MFTKLVNLFSYRVHFAIPDEKAQKSLDRTKLRKIQKKCIKYAIEPHTVGSIQMADIQKEGKKQNTTTSHILHIVYSVA